jgi:hypothetical protein
LPKCDGNAGGWLHHQKKVVEKLAQGAAGKALFDASTAALRDFSPVFVRFGSKADITRHVADVRFTPESGQTADVPVGPLCAKSGLMHCNKIGASFDHLVGARQQCWRDFKAQRVKRPEPVMRRLPRRKVK